MESKIKFNLKHREANSINLHCLVFHQPGKTFLSKQSPSYRCGCVNVQIQVLMESNKHPKRERYTKHKMSICARVTKIFKGDNMTYNLTVTIDDELAEINIIFSEGFTWHKLYCDEPRVFEIGRHRFDLNVQCDLAKSVGPFALLYDNASLIDFELRGEGGSVVAVHGAVLAACSPVLKQMLSNGKATNVTVANATMEILECFKDYIYLHKLPEEDAYLEQLLLIGSSYSMSDLVQKCTVTLLNRLNSENIVSLAEFAANFKLRHLLLYILHVIQTGIIEVDTAINTDNWEETCERINIENKT